MFNRLSKIIKKVQSLKNQSWLNENNAQEEIINIIGVRVKLNQKILFNYSKYTQKLLTVIRIVFRNKTLHGC